MKADLACVWPGEYRVYKAGESWSELPGDRHKVSANASETKPAKLLAVSGYWTLCISRPFKRVR